MPIGHKKGVSEGFIITVTKEKLILLNLLNGFIHQQLNEHIITMRQRMFMYVVAAAECP